MMDINFRKLQSHESDLYRQIRLESLDSFPEAFGASKREESALSKLRFEMFIEQQIPEKFMIGAFKDNQLIGICGFIREEQQRSNHRGIVIQMYVKPAFTGYKIGYRIIEKIIAEAFAIKGVEMLLLGVIANNNKAIHIYEQLGFSEYGFLKNYYKDGEKYIDHYFMVLNK